MIWIVIALLGILLIFAFVLFYIACGRCDRATEDLEKMLSRSVYALSREESLQAQRWLAEKAPERVWTTSHDGLTLAADFLPCENARGTIMLFHGWRSRPLADFGPAMQSYYGKGLNLLLVHQRGRGPSKGRFVTFGIKEHRDVHCWVQWHGEHFGKDAPIVLSGLSMGASTVLMACGEPFSANVRGVIADCGFTSPKEIIASVCRRAHVPTWPTVPLMGLFAKLLAGFGFSDYSTVEAMAQAKLPILFAHGEADRFVPCEMTKQAYAACTSPDKTLLLVKEARHGTSYLLERPRYEATVTQFLNRILP